MSHLLMLSDDFLGHVYTFLGDRAILYGVSF